ncbi:hypothetical protein RRG08_008849 [Elysia crispata]|uniref:Uncharacterized protein n=1 Tax=Elysia crispata TaxID=231223 RepID=A0AAE1DUR9_9GAST|nr:hypothetical protein RRG08_008849 [Elysia crispata]
MDLSSWSAVPVGVGDHVPPRLSVTTFHNQVDPLPPPVHLPSPSQIFSQSISRFPFIFPAALSASKGHGMQIIGGAEELEVVAMAKDAKDILKKKLQISVEKLDLEKLHGDKYVRFIIAWYPDNWFKVKDNHHICTVEQLEEAHIGSL